MLRILPNELQTPKTNIWKVGFIDCKQLSVGVVCVSLLSPWKDSPPPDLRFFRPSAAVCRDAPYATALLCHVRVVVLEDPPLLAVTLPLGPTPPDIPLGWTPLPLGWNPLQDDSPPSTLNLIT